MRRHEERINAILPELDAMMDGGLITLEKAQVIIYRPHKAPPREPNPEGGAVPCPLTPES